MSPLTVGVDLGGTHIRAVAFDDGLRPLARAAAPTAAEEGVDAVVGRVADSVRAALARAGSDLEDVRAGSGWAPRG